MAFRYRIFQNKLLCHIPCVSCKRFPQLPVLLWYRCIVFIKLVYTKGTYFIKSAVVYYLSKLATMAAKHKIKGVYGIESFKFSYHYTLIYRPFHKTLPRTSAFINWITVRFYETGCSLRYFFFKISYRNKRVLVSCIASSKMTY